MIVDHSEDVERPPTFAGAGQTNGAPRSTSWSTRLATPEDAAQIASLMAEVWTINEAWSVPAAEVEKLMEEQFSTEAVRIAMQGENVRTYVAVETSPGSPTNFEEGRKRGSGPIIGVALSIVDCPEPNVSSSRPLKLVRLYVDFAHHGSGVARDLFRHTLQLARREKAGSIWLTTWTKSDRAIRFYEKNGFKKIGRERFKVGDVYQEDWVMERILEPLLNNGERL